MAQQTGSLQVFRALLPPESLEGHGDKEGKARGKEQCGRNKSQFPGHHEQLLEEGGEGFGPSERTTSCVGSGCKLADTQGRNYFHGDMGLRCHSMPLPCFVQHVLVCFLCSIEYWQPLTVEGFLQWQKWLTFPFPTPSSTTHTCPQAAAHEPSSLVPSHLVLKQFPFGWGHVSGHSQKDIPQIARAAHLKGWRAVAEQQE